MVANEGTKRDLFASRKRNMQPESWVDQHCIHPKDPKLSMSPANWAMHLGMDIQLQPTMAALLCQRAGRQEPDSLDMALGLVRFGSGACFRFRTCRVDIAGNTNRLACSHRLFFWLARNGISFSFMSRTELIFVSFCLSSALCNRSSLSWLALAMVRQFVCTCLPDRDRWVRPAFVVQCLAATCSLWRFGAIYANALVTIITRSFGRSCDSLKFTFNHTS
jgi:hypothetical protein